MCLTFDGPCLTPHFPLKTSWHHPYFSVQNREEWCVWRSMLGPHFPHKISWHYPYFSVQNRDEGCFWRSMHDPHFPHKISWHCPFSTKSGRGMFLSVHAWLPVLTQNFVTLSLLFSCVLKSRNEGSVWRSMHDPCYLTKNFMTLSLLFSAK